MSFNHECILSRQTAQGMPGKTPASAKQYHAPRVERRHLRISEGCAVRRPRRFLHFQARRYPEHANGSGHVTQDPQQVRNAIMLRVSREDSYEFRRGALSDALGDSFTSQHEDPPKM